MKLAKITNDRRKEKSKKQDKWLTGIFLLLLGVGALNLIGKDLAATLEKGIKLLNADPENYYSHWLISKVSGVDKTKLEWLSAGTFVYALYLWLKASV